MSYNDAEHVMNSIDAVETYSEYVPEEEMLGEPERERFESAVESIRRAFALMDVDDYVEWDEERRS